MNKPVADDFDYINKRLKQIEAEKTEIINRGEPECVPPEKADVPIEAYEDSAAQYIPWMYSQSSEMNHTPQQPKLGDALNLTDGSIKFWDGEKWVHKK